MESDTLFWFIVYYLRMLPVLAGLALGMFLVVELSGRFEKQRPWLFVILMGATLFLLTAASAADLAEVMHSGKWTVWVVIRPIGYAYWLVLLRDRARKTVGITK